MNAIAGPSRAIVRVPPRAFRHASSVASATKIYPAKQAAFFLPPDHPDAVDTAHTAHYVVKAAARGSTAAWGRWAQEKSDRGIPEQENLQKLASQRDKPRPHPAQIEFEEAAAVGMREDFGDGSLDDLRLDAVPLGSIIEIRRSFTSYYGCLISRVFSLECNKVSLRSLTPAGFILTHTITDVFFTVPAYFPKTLVHACGYGDVPHTKAQENARLAIMHRLLELTADVEKTLVAIVPRASRLYPNFKASDPDAWAALSVIDAARFVDSTSPDKVPATRTIFATHKYMLSNPDRFLIDPMRHRVSQSFSLRPQRDVEAIEKTRNWILNDEPPIRKFIKKAGVITSIYRSLRKPSGPIEAIDTSSLPAFDTHDQMIIRALRAIIERTRFIQADPMALGTEGIIKLVNGYNRGVAGNDSRDTVATFLTELGVYAPWTDLTESRILLPRRTPEQQKAFEDDGTRMLKLHAARKLETASRPVTPMELYPTDPCARIRHDFGQLPVYVIDDASAQELDDGLSVEPIPGSTDIRIHIHIADPTRLLHPDNLFSREARNRSVTAYFVDHTVPMLPRTLVDAGLGLMAGKAAHTLSFSARIDELGMLSEVEIRPGVVRNVMRLTYVQLGKALGMKVSLPSELIRLISVTSPAKEGDNSHLSLPAEVSLDDIRRLYDGFNRLQGRRTARDWFAGYQNLAEVRLLQHDLPQPPAVPDRPMMWHGFPQAEVMGVKVDEAQTVVAEYMLAAGLMAAKWASERGVPIIYRGSEMPISANPDAFGQALALREKNNFVEAIALARLDLAFQLGKVGIEPLRHFSIGVSAKEGGYARVTSPLRRYADLVNHWMIKAALLDPSLQTLPFSKEEMSAIATEQLYREQMGNRRMRMNNTLWICRLLSQALTTDAHPELREFLTGPRGFTVAVRERPRAVGGGGRGLHLSVMIRELGIAADVRHITKERAAASEPGDELNVRMVMVALESLPQIFCEVVE